VSDVAERNERQQNVYAVEVKIPDCQVVKVAAGNLSLLSWDSQDNRVTFESEAKNHPQGRISFQKRAGKWERAGDIRDTKSEKESPIVSLEESLNESSVVVVTDPLSKRKSKILDLNPQFQHVTLGEVKEITWTTATGDVCVGALYLPPNFVRGRKYPLVVQTHGYAAGRFSIDGPAPTVFAAQVLANRGFVVIQVPDPPYRLLSTPKEIGTGVRIIEGAIKKLESQGIIDRDRIGIIGFSRTGLFVKSLITSSRLHFGAAVVADASDINYFRYMAFANSRPDLALDMEHLVGRRPFNSGLQAWLERADGFRMGQVNTPLLIEAIGPSSLLSDWEWFSGLTSLGKPVELLYLPFGIHLLERPFERFDSEQNAVDWLCFWLQGKEDSDPAKSEQYRRWRGMRISRNERGAAKRPRPAAVHSSAS
jgi:hypothetical protein